MPIDRVELQRPPAREVIGREDELGSLHAALDRIGSGPAAIVLEGEAGIGKSTLWLAGAQAARDRGFRTLVSRPAEAERALAHAVLGDLFDGVLDDVLPALPAPRRHALEVALLVEEDARPSNPRTLGVAIRSALDVLAAEQPVVLAVDDVQWLDRSSGSALAFAVRRLREDGVLLLLARRLADDAEPSELERAIDPEHTQRLTVGPLSLGATHRLLQARLGRAFTRPTLLRVHETSGGNPFYALELAQALSADPDPMQSLQVPATLDGLVRERLDGLPAATREALVLAAAVGRPSRELLAGLDVTEPVLEPAFAAHVIERENGTIRFTHPLLASVLEQGVPADDRRRAHGRVAAVVEDPLDRARHLGLSTDSPDPEIAAVLEHAAHVASVRGAPIAAAELGEHALRLTPSDAPDDRHRRALAAARAHRSAGEGARGRTIAAEVVAASRPGRERAEALDLLADFEDPQARMVTLLLEALGEAAGNEVLEAMIHLRLATGGRFTEGWVWAEDHARSSFEIAERLDDAALRACALSVLAALRFGLGDPEAHALAERAQEAAAAIGDLAQLEEAGWGVAHVLTWSMDTERARAWLESQHRAWSDRDEPLSAEALWFLALVELHAGRWSLAAEYAERVGEVNAQYGTEVPQQIYVEAFVAAHRGELERARDLAERGGKLAEGVMLARVAAVQGLVELWSGDAEAASASFASAEETADAAGWREPSYRLWRGDYVEALLELDRVEDAVSLLDAWEADAVRVGREWVLAQVTRCRGLVAAARGDVEHAVSLLEQAVGLHEDAGDPFGRARALLALGVVRRRARQKRAARDAIDAALAGFEELGAATWVEKALAELGRVGGRTRVEGLTPAEQRVADLVAGGRTNREVAATLFLGERTVSSHLTRIYAKLGVRSRTELARRLQ